VPVVHCQTPELVHSHVSEPPGPAEPQPLPGLQHGAPLGPHADGSQPPVPPVPEEHCHVKAFEQKHEMEGPPPPAVPHPIPGLQQVEPLGPQPVSLQPPPMPPVPEHSQVPALEHQQSSQPFGDA
jgi:hypothetical protein